MLRCAGRLARGLAAGLAMAGALVMAQPADRPGAPPPPIETGLLDCSLYRYGSGFDAAIAATLGRIAAATDTDPSLREAFRGPRSLEVTDALYRLGIVQGVVGCTQPVVRGFAGNGSVALQFRALQSAVCEQLVGSETLRLGGLLVEPLHAPSGEARCGIGRNLVPGLLTLGRLTQAGRSLPGENTVTVVSRGPFAAAPPQLPRPQPADTCPSIAGRRDPMVEDMIAKQRFVTYDFPRNWQAERCYDILGGPSSTGMTCVTADWNNYHDRLYAQFELMMARAEPSRDPERFFSAAYWLIRRSDPLRLTIRSFDYVGRECDVIRNRILVGWGQCMWDTARKAYDAYHGKATEADAGLFRDTVLEAVPICFAELPEHYGKANEFIDRYLRPQPFLEKRPEILAQVQQRVREAMARAGYGDCPYYAQAVMRIDHSVWRDHYSQGAAQLPIDWEHDFWKSAGRCLATAR